MTKLGCKMCGGPLNFYDGESVCECEYCGTRQSVMRISEERIIALYNKANMLRQNGAFDRAERIFETIVAERCDDPEIHWSLMLCRFGIEYVEDRSLIKGMPTCHRTAYSSVFDDIDYIEAIKYADADAARFYENEAKYIDKIQREILSFSEKQQPYDVFICYKESDADGERTIDSIKAEEIYNSLIKNGYKVFFSRVSLKDKLGHSYEPYIFSALNTAKIMLLVCTKPEHVNAVWVKNEWSRFINIAVKKKECIFIPCYQNLIPDDLPDEISHFQGMDMSKIGFIQDLVHGIKKLIPIEQNINKPISVIRELQFQQSRAKGLIRSISMAVEEKNWDSAYFFCSQLKTALQQSIAEPLYKLYIDFSAGKDVLPACSVLNELSLEITDEEKHLINKTNFPSFFIAFLRGKCFSRARYIMDNYPEILQTYISQDNFNLSLLNCAVYKYKDAFMLNKLLELGFDPNNSVRYSESTKKRKIYPPLDDAILQSNAQMVKLLLEHGADPNKISIIEYDDDGNKNIISALSNAVCNSGSSMIVEMLIKHGADPNRSFRIINGRNGPIAYIALRDAIYMAKNINVVKILLQYGADPNASTEIFYDNGLRGTESMLSAAICRAKNTGMIKELLYYGADLKNSCRTIINAYGERKYSPLSDAIQSANSADIVEILLQGGAEADHIESYINESGKQEKKTMLTYAIADAQNERIIELLLRYGASWEHEIIYNGKKRIERKYPYQKIVTKELAKFMKAAGWRGGLF